tara:strand:- start:880 stop:1725 length:846 start_codon:yes stop_codon:yes gene_type:complete
MPKTKYGGASGNLNNLSKQTSNAAKDPVGTYQKSSPIGKIIFFIFIIAFIIGLIYVIYIAVQAVNKAKSSNPVIINDVIDANVARPSFALPEVTSGMNQSFSTWFYVKDWNYKFGQYKWILWKGNPKTTSDSNSSGNIHSPSLWLYPLTNSLKVVTSTTDTSAVESCDIPNIPLMTWVHVVYVLNNRTVDIYINGKLERSCALRGVPILDDSPVYITGGSPDAGFYGKMGKTQYFTKALLPNEVVNLYQQGPLGSTQYQIQFFQDGKFVSVNSASSFAEES